MSTRRSHLVATLALAGALTLAGCSQGEGEPSTGASPEEGLVIEGQSVEGGEVPAEESPEGKPPGSTDGRTGQPRAGGLDSGPLPKIPEGEEDDLGEGHRKMKKVEGTDFWIPADQEVAPKDEPDHAEFKEAPAAATSVATKYLNLKFNVNSYEWEKPQDWVDKISKLSTKSHIKNKWPDTGSYDESRNFEWTLAHEEGIKSEVEADCVTDPTAMEPTGSEMVVRCRTDVYVINRDGDRLGPSEIPDMWYVFGKQQDGLLHLKQEGGDWKVHGDYTGQAW